MKNITIKDLIQKTNNVPVAIDENGVESINVRGLALRDIGLLYAEHKDIMVKLIGKDDSVADKEDETGIDWAKVVQIAPEFIAKVIAKGAKCSTEDAANLPFGIQARIVIGIWNASQIDQSMIEDVVKKILAALTSVTTAIGSNQ
ncbi:hypothetical protein vBVhaSVHB1_16 [Vibrio phage vB_VhaS-VHB1]|nr:hypothetical protein vBVhaSVHB1_16 [Vibrio phage vB_VhaS-VHB1]